MFFELYHDVKYAKYDLPLSFCQDNCSYSHRAWCVASTIKWDCTQGKLAFVLSGTVLDVAVDIRVGSSTFGKHVAVELSAENMHQFFLTTRTAHGMSVLSNEAVFAYKCHNALRSRARTINPVLRPRPGY